MKSLRILKLASPFIVSAIVAIALIAYSSDEPPKIAVPTEFFKFRSISDTYTIEAPSNWQRSESDGGWFAERRSIFAVKGAEIMVADDNLLFSGDTSVPPEILHAKNATNKTTHLILSQQAFAKSDPLWRPPGETPAEYQHRMLKTEDFNQRFGSMADSSPQSLPNPLGPGIMTEFTISADKSQKRKLWQKLESTDLQDVPWTIHGCRATILGPTRRIYIVCLCPELDWAAMKPAFLRVIQSLDLP